ncbi:TPA: hypothetical protein KV183_003434 [Morganella morganii]|nr:hypothetical protein [Morganella morganii]HEI9846868.1 hypothetical protein [Morganella morganii]
MSIKKVLLGMMICLTISSTALAVPFKYNYKVEGSVAGVVSQQRAEFPCYVAIKSSDPHYNGKYHAMYNVNQCQTARMAYALGLPVKIWAKIANGNESNEVVAIELYNSSVYWWN